MMRPLYVPQGDHAPPATLGVDGNPQGCAAIYSHWPGQSAPPEIIADTSTAMLLRAARDPQRWLSGFEWCANDHMDADGILSMTLACRPELAVSLGPTLVGAAAYGDFCHWPGPDAARVALRVHQIINQHQAQANSTNDGTSIGDAWQQACCDYIVNEIETIVAESKDPDDQRDQQIALIQGARSRLEAGGDDGFYLSRCTDITLTVVHAAYQHGHHSDGPTSVHVLDDCPPWALHGFVPNDHFQLLCLHGTEGWHYFLDAPRHSWALTVHLPTVSWPSCEAVAQTLSNQDGACTWSAGEAAREQGFTCLLASHVRQPSQLSSTQVVAALRSLWRTSAESAERP